jgi:hypothetical protein
MHRLRPIARIAAHLIVLLLATAWTAGANVSLSSPLFDIARPRIGDVIIKVGSVLALAPEGTLVLAQALAGFKLALGLFLFMAVIAAAYDRLRWGASDDAMLDVALMLSAIASGVATMAFVEGGGRHLIEGLGELILCAMAGALAAFGHGAQWRMADPALRGGGEAGPSRHATACAAS